VIYVRWNEAQDFCEWLTQKWHNEGRLPRNWQVQLPSEAEWEKAARGGVEIPVTSRIRSIAAIAFEASSPMALQANPLPQRRYPWGDQFDTNLANSDETNIGSASAVGCFPHGQSPYGCEEMSGNVWQWTRSQFRDYPYNPHDGREDLDATSVDARVLRGGAWGGYPLVLACAFRFYSEPDYWSYIFGFRVVCAASHRF